MKLLAVTGLVVGILVLRIALAAKAGVIACFLGPAAAHIRAKYLENEF